MSTQTEIASMFEETMERCSLTDHYVIERSKHRLGVIDYITIQRKKDGARVATVEISLARNPDHHVRITAHEPEEMSWGFGSDPKSIREAKDHLTVGLSNLCDLP